MTFEKDFLKQVAEDLNLKDEEELKLEEDEEIEEDEETINIEDEDLVLDDDEDEEDDEDDDEDEDEETEPEKPAQPVVTETQTKPKPTRDEKAQYAFEKLRKEAESAKTYEKQLNEIAAMYGFTDSKEMLTKLQKDAIAKQAKEKGIDPAIYEEWQETKKQLEQIKQEREQEIAIHKIQKVLSQIDVFATKNNLSETEKEELIDRLDEDGFTIETLSTIKNHEKVFAGYLSDKIMEKEKQKMLEKETKRKKLEEEKFSKTAAPTEKVNLETLLNTLFKTNK